MGPNEMTIGELRRRMNTLTVAGRPVGSRNAAVMYHTRLALPCAAFVLTLFALSVMPRRPVRRGLLAAATCGAGLAYVVLLILANKAGRYGPLPVVLATWLPNLVFVLAATAFVIRRAADRERLHAHD
jgi:lipopolysaccharide export LptBFGC system permease protein LptF